MPQRNRVPSHRSSKDSKKKGLFPSIPAKVLGLTQIRQAGLTDPPPDGKHPSSCSSSPAPLPSLRRAGAVVLSTEDTRRAQP